jgi:hypothetical protein
VAASWITPTILKEAPKASHPLKQAYLIFWQQTQRVMRGDA